MLGNGTSSLPFGGTLCFGECQKEGAADLASAARGVVNSDCIVLEIIDHPWGAKGARRRGWVIVVSNKMSCPEYSIVECKELRI